VTNQLLRVIIAGVIALISLLGVIVLAFASVETPSIVEAIALASVVYLFGVTTNGSGLGLVHKDSAGVEHPR